jgi:hypothetical protein
LFGPAIIAALAFWKVRSFPFVEVTTIAESDFEWKKRRKCGWLR